MLAYLISAYRDPEHLRALIEALDYEADFYVHIDANVDEAPFRAVLPGKVRFVPRHRVSWGGWEQVEYQYELMRAALASSVAYTHLVCLSAQDYPLWSNSRIHAFFTAHAGQQLMAGYDLTRTDDAGQRRKFTHIHPFRDLPWSNRWLKNKVIVASRTLLSVFGVRRIPQVRIGDRLCDIYFGSDYWAITPECARYLVAKLEQEPQIKRYFKTTFVPSEMCLQTLVYNSPFAPHDLLQTGRYPGLTSLTPLHYIHYGACIKILTEDDWETLHHCGKMFCRKIVSGTSDGLKYFIDRERAL